MEEDKFKDLLEDEELRSLRLAALATKRLSDSNVDQSPESASALPISSIALTSSTIPGPVSNQIPFVQSDRSAHNNNYTWRKQNQSCRRRGGSFPKNSQRSNLIVISPVALDEQKDSKEKTPALILPQHKWCNSGNEDSMSPKTLRRTGPTRFNRHGSDSESSDESDYENSGNDSGSNETILQDEPPEHFVHSSPGCHNLSDNGEKKRRLSFQSLDSEVKPDNFDKNETSSVYNLLKNSSPYADKPDSYAPVQNIKDSQTWNHSVESKYSNYKSYKTEPAYATNADLQENFIRQTNSSIVNNGNSCIDQANVFMRESCDPSESWTNLKNSNPHYFKDPDNLKNKGSSDKKSPNYLDKKHSLDTFGDINGSKTSIWKHEGGSGASNSYFTKDISYSDIDSRNYKNDERKSQYLSQNDLRLELKKRMREIKTSPDNSENDKMLESNAWDRNTSRFEQNSGQENDSFKNMSNINRKSHQRSISRERIPQDSFSSREKNRFERAFPSERRRYGRSSSLGRSRYDRSCSPGRRRNDRSSSRDRRSYHKSVSPDKKRLEQSKMKHGSSDQIADKREEHSFRGRTSYHERSVSEERKRNRYKYTHKSERSERSRSRDKRKRGSSSSSDSKHDRSVSRDRDRFSHYSSVSKQKRELDVVAPRDKHELKQHHRNTNERSSSEDSNHERRHASQDRRKYDRSLSRDRSRHGSSHSRSSTSDRSYSRRRRSSSRDESKIGHSSGELKNKLKSKGTTCNASVYNSKLNKPLDRFSQEKSMPKCEPVGKKLQKSNNFPDADVENSSNIKELKLGNRGIKEQCSSVVQNKSHRSRSKERRDRNKSSQRYSGSNSYLNRFSRSRSNSSESYSSSWSSSSSRSSRPKVPSVPSVVKSVLVKKNDTESRETSAEIKSFSKNSNPVTSLSYLYSASSKKKADAMDCNKLSNMKGAHMDGDLKASDNKRMPVHMRLGAFPRKRVIQMPKDVEAAFVNSSSSSDDESVNTKCKRQNIRIVTDVYDAKSKIDTLQPRHPSKEMSTKRSPDVCQDKSKRMKSHR